MDPSLPIGSQHQTYSFFSSKVERCRRDLKQLIAQLAKQQISENEIDANISRFITKAKINAWTGLTSFDVILQVEAQIQESHSAHFDQVHRSLKKYVKNCRLEAWKLMAKKMLQKLEDSLSVEEISKLVKDFLIRTLLSQGVYLLTLEEGKKQIESLNRELPVSIKRKDIQKALSSIKFSSLERIPPSFLKKVTDNSFKELCKIIQEINFLNSHKGPANERVLDHLIKDLKARYLHFLVKCTKIPISDVKREMQVPLVEYIDNNDPVYYRGDGGVAIKLFKVRIKKLLPPKVYKLRVIKNGEFEFFIKTVCKHAELNYIEVSSDEMNSLNPQLEYFIDLSQKFYQLSRRLSIGEYLSEVHKVFNEYQQWSETKDLEYVRMGGVITIGGQDLFISQNALGLSLKFESYQNLGYHSEIMEMKHHLINSGFTLEELKQYFSLIGQSADASASFAYSIQELASSKIDHQEVAKLIASCLEQCKLDISRHHLSLFKNFIEVLNDNYVKSPRLKSCPFIPALYQQALENIAQRINKIQNAEKNQSLDAKQRFQAIQQESDLILEDLEYLMVLSDLKLNLHKNISLIPSPIPNHTRYAYTSGMRCYMAISEAILSIYQNKPKPQKAILIEGSYYELLEEEDGFSKFVKESFSSQLIKQDHLNEEILSEVAAMYLDLYPNFVTLDEVRKINVVELVQKALRVRSIDEPLVVVLDTATTLFFDSEIEAIYQTFRDAIENKKLIFVVTSSLAKFAQGGADKYTGGVVLVAANENYQATFCTELKIHQDRDSFSVEAHRFHSIFFKECQSELRDYVNMIRANTHYIYQHLEKLFGDGSIIQIGKKDKNVPMMGLHFRIFLQEKLKLPEGYLPRLVQLMGHYINARSAQKNLPLRIRGSFGFTHATCVECKTALRLTIGLEEQLILNEYIKMFEELQSELEVMTQEENNLLFKTLTYDQKIDDELSEESESEESEKEADLTAEKCITYSIQLAEITSSEGLKGFLEFVLGQLNSHASENVG